MLKSQTLALKMSEIRQKRDKLVEAVNAADDSPTEAQENERRGLSDELATAETEFRAALETEGEDEARARGMFGPGDGEPAEVRQLLGRVTLADYLTPASGGLGLNGAAAELNAALEVPTVGQRGGVAIPWALLETRAFTTTTQNDGGQVQRPILQRLFGPGIMDALGVRMDSVPAGRSEWPVITGGGAPAQAKEPDAAAAAAPATFGTAQLKPKRLTGVYEYSHEEAASVADIEQALRRDLADAIASQMSDQIINGPAPSGAAPQNVRGFISRIGAATDLGAAEADAAAYGRLHALAVDGIHAGKESEVSSVIGEETYRHSAGVYIAGSGKSGSQLLTERSMSCEASSYVPDEAGKKQSAILHAAGPNGGGIMRGDSVAAIWPTLEVIRDHCCPVN